MRRHATAVSNKHFMFGGRNEVHETKFMRRRVYVCVWWQKEPTKPSVPGGRTEGRHQDGKLRS